MGRDGGGCYHDVVCTKYLVLYCTGKVKYTGTPPLVQYRYCTAAYSTEALLFENRFHKNYLRTVTLGVTRSPMPTPAGSLFKYNNSNRDPPSTVLVVNFAVHVSVQSFGLAGSAGSWMKSWTGQRESATTPITVLMTHLCYGRRKVRTQIDEGRILLRTVPRGIYSSL